MRTRAWLVALAATALACTGSPTAPTGVAAVAVTGVIPAVGDATQLRAVAVFSGSGTIRDITTDATWHSDNPSVAWISTDGVLAVVGPGDAHVSATFEGVSGVREVSIDF